MTANPSTGARGWVGEFCEKDDFSLERPFGVGVVGACAGWVDKVKDWLEEVV
jgi:hypothetical protein